MGIGRQRDDSAPVESERQGMSILSPFRYFGYGANSVQGEHPPSDEDRYAGGLGPAVEEDDTSDEEDDEAEDPQLAREREIDQMAANDPRSIAENLLDAQRRQEEKERERIDGIVSGLVRPPPTQPAMDPALREQIRLQRAETIQRGLEEQRIFAQRRQQEIAERAERKANASEGYDKLTSTPIQQNHIESRMYDESQFVRDLQRLQRLSQTNPAVLTDPKIKYVLNHLPDSPDSPHLPANRRPHMPRSTDRSADRPAAQATAEATVVQANLYRDLQRLQVIAQRNPEILLNPQVQYVLKNLPKRRS